MVFFIIVFLLIGTLFSYFALRILCSQDWAKHYLLAQWNLAGKAIVQALGIEKTLTIMKYGAVLTLVGVTFTLVFGAYIIQS